jgi:hypothetical protein
MRRNEERGTKMYTKDTIVRRPSLGWFERRRYFRRLFEHERFRALKTEETPKLPPPGEKD